MPSATYTVNRDAGENGFGRNDRKQKYLQDYVQEIELPSVVVSASINPGLSNSTLHLNNTAVKTKCKTDPDRRDDFSLLHIFRYADIWDRVLMVIGIVMSLATGASLPILSMFFGDMTNTFIRQTTARNPVAATTSTPHGVNSTYFNGTTVTEFDLIPPLTPQEFDEYMTQFSLYYLYIGVCVMLAAFVQTWCWETACERQVYRLRNVFFSQIVRQDITWFDTNQTGNLTTKLFDDLERVREGLSSKFSMLTQYVSTFVSGLLVGFYISPKLTGLLLLVGPLIIGITAFLSKNAASACSREQVKYAVAGSIAEEVFTAMRTVAAFGLEKLEILRYASALKEGRDIATKRYRTFSIGLGTVFMLMYVGYGFAFYYGAHLVLAGEATPGTVFTVFFSVMTGAFSIGSALPYLNSVTTAVGVAKNLYRVIDRVPAIDPYSDTGTEPKRVVGKVEVRNVDFRYPSRPEVKVLDGLNLTIEPGQTVALVGSSGAGKSTIVGLLLRFYDPEAGQIYLDSVRLPSLNVRWLRDQIGIVSQEPILFGVSIADNIRYGRDDITNEELVDAAIQASAHNFIKKLPNGYSTYVGDRGCQLSGGQKQRIAIARALVRNPQILLLDEATSALDSQSEGIVQEALDRVMKGRTTIIVAHRLSTIKNADVIHAMKNGKILESGTHDELMDKKGLYHNLVMAQTKVSDKNKEVSNLGQVDSVENVDLDEVHEDTTCEDDEEEEYTDIPEELQNLNEVRKTNVPKHHHGGKVKKNSKYCMWKLIKLNSPEWAYLLFGCIGCIINGALVPIYAYLYGQVFESLTLKGEELKREARFWSFMFVLLGIMCGSATILQTWLFTFASEKLMMRLRVMAFTNILKQAVGWFDNKDSCPGVLTTKLARDAPTVKAAGGMRAGQVMSAVVTLATAVCIAFIYGWKLAIILALSVPLIIGAAYQQQTGLRKHQQRDAKFMGEAGRIATESVQNVRTVQSLGKERTFVDLYRKSLRIPNKEAKKQAYVYAALFAMSQSITYVLYSVAFRYGSYLVLEGEMTPSAVYRVFFALSFSAHSVGHAMAFLQDYAKAKHSASLMFQLIEKPTEIDSQSNDGQKPEIRGKISFKGVHFAYPTRKANRVLNNMDFTVEPGKTLALVGESGCGKSTVISLLERFYNPSYGTIEIDGHDIRNINVRHLRNNIGLVTQEPVLFDCSIRENIGYGANSEDTVPFDAIVEAAKKANAHNFIVNLPQGYDTMAGDRGTQLSGGQKQRIAIARALIRNPKILLLDEATSALDTESEKVVQEALNEAGKGRTCITIAHRLSTIQTADLIAVVCYGQITELGTHAELEDLKGTYYELVKRQQM